MSEIVNSSLKNTVKGTSLMLSGTLLGSFLVFTIKLLIARNVTKEELGIYSLAIAVVNIISLVSCLGLQDGLVRHISFLLGKCDKGAVIANSQFSIKIGILSGLAVTVLMYLLAGVTARYIFYMPSFEAPLRIISLYIPFFVLSQIISGILRGHGIIAPKVYYLDVGFHLLYLLFLGFSFFVKLPFASILYAYIFSMAIAFVLIGRYSYKRLGISPLPSNGSMQGNELLKISIPLLVGSVTSILLSWTDTLMLGRYAGAEAVGAYSVSILLAKLIPFPLGALEFAFMPIAGEMYAKSQIPELRRTYQILTKWIFSATLPIFLIVFLFPEMTLAFLFGDHFISASPALRILSLGFLLHSFFGANGILMVIVGKSAEIINVSLFGLALNIILNYVLIKQLGYGIIGASVATVGTHVALNIIVSSIIYRRCRIHPFTSEYLKPIIGSIIISLVIYGIAKSLPLYFWMLPAYFIAFVCSYIASLFLTKSIEREDVALLEMISKRMGIGDWLLKKATVRRCANNEPS